MPINTNLSAWAYNRQARTQGREDWATAYKADILDVPKTNIDKLKTIDKKLGREWTVKALQWAWVTADRLKKKFTPTQPVWQPVQTGDLVWATWYDKSQVWMPWVNLIKPPKIPKPISKAIAPTFKDTQKVEQPGRRQTPEEIRATHASFAETTFESKKAREIGKIKEFARNEWRELTEAELSTISTIESRERQRVSAWTTGTWIQSATWWVTTWIPELDSAISDIRKNKDKSITEAIKSYNIAKWEFEKNKWYYKNFDNVNETFQGVLWDLEELQRQGIEPTPEDYQQIANKYGLDVNDVITPTNLFNKLEFTDEWKNKFWVAKAEAWIEWMTRDFERRKEDMAYNLEVQTEALNNQIEDVKTQLKRNLEFMTKQWAWSGWLKSSWYEQGLQNVKSDWEKTIWRLNTLLTRMQNADEKNVARLTEDYNRALWEAKTNLDDQLQNVRINTWLQLEGITDKYGVWNETLTNALNNINREFSDQSQAAVSDYLKNMRTIQDMTNSEIDRETARQDTERQRLDTRFNEYLSNDWLLLNNTSLMWLQDEINSWRMSVERARDLQNIMLSTITNTLSQVWTVTESDLSSIESLLWQGKTPAQIIASMKQLEKFSQVQELEQKGAPKVERIGTDDFGNPIYWTYNQSTEQYEPIQGQQGQQGIWTASTTWTTSMADFIKWWEWFRTEAYLDIAWVPTVGYWFTTLNWKPVKMWDSMTREQADKEFEKQVATYQNFRNDVTVDLNENQQTALTSFEYNLGRNIWKWEGWKAIIAYINAGDFQWAWEIMKAYINARDPVTKKLTPSNWLINRRNKEVALMNTPVTETWEKDIAKWYTPNQKAIIKKYLNNPSSKDTRMALKRAWLSDSDVNQYQEWRKQAEGMAFGLTAIVPRDLWKTNEDMEKLENAVSRTIEELEKRWIEPTEANVADHIRWYKINEDVNPELSKRYREILTFNAKETDRLDWSNVANALNKWDIEGAEKYVSNLIWDLAQDKFGNDYVSWVNLKQQGKDVNRLRELIARNPDKIWAFEWRMSDVARKFKDEPEMQELQTLLTMQQAELRKYFAWSAVTETELEAIKDYIGWDTNMTPNNLMTMLDTIYNRTQSKYGLQRNRFRFTPLDKTPTEPIDISKSQSLWSLWAWLWAWLGFWTWTTWTYDPSKLDDLESWFFQAETTWPWQLDQTDLDYFNNLQ